MILNCAQCGAAYDTADLAPAQPVRCACGDVLLVPTHENLDLTHLVERYVHRWASSRGYSAGDLAESPPPDGTHDAAADQTTTSPEPPPMSAWSFIDGSARVRIVHDRCREELAIDAFVIPLPRDPTARGELCQYVLTLNHAQTGTSRFALDGDQLVLIARRPTLGLDYHEFEHLVDSVARVADDFDDELLARFTEPAVRLTHDDRSDARTIDPN